MDARTQEILAWYERWNEGSIQPVSLDTRICTVCQTWACFYRDNTTSVCELHRDDKRGLLAWTSANMHKLSKFLALIPNCGPADLSLRPCAEGNHIGPFLKENKTQNCELHTHDLILRFCAVSFRFCVFPSVSADQTCLIHKPYDNSGSHVHISVASGTTPSVSDSSGIQYQNSNIVVNPEGALGATYDQRIQVNSNHIRAHWQGLSCEYNALAVASQPSILDNHQVNASILGKNQYQTGSEQNSGQRVTLADKGDTSKGVPSSHSEVRNFAPIPLAHQQMGDNLFTQLRVRESGLGNTGATSYLSRQLYQHLYPTQTVREIVEPHVFVVRRFSPCGEYLLCVHRSNNVSLYTVGWPTWSEDISFPAAIRQTLFEQFFKLHKEVTGLWCEEDGQSEQQYAQAFCRDFALFTKQSHYLILASSAPRPPAAPHPHFPLMPNVQSPMDYDNIPSSTQEVLGQIANLEDTIFHLVRVKSGQRCDRMRFRHDSIPISSVNNGVYLHGMTMAVLSLQYQNIHIITIRNTGTFVPTRKIGLFCYDQDELLVAQYNATQLCHAQTLQTHMDFPSALTCALGGLPLPNCFCSSMALSALGGLKHRILSYLFKQAVNSNEKDTALHNFCFHFKQLEELAMLKVQLMDDEHLLIKYGAKDAAAGHLNDTSLQTMFYVLYNLCTTDVIGVYENTSETFLNMLLSGSDYLFTSSFDLPTSAVSSYANNQHMRKWLETHKQAIKHARNGGHSNAIKKILALFPLACQSFNQSPYFDFSLFSYDDKVVSPFERPYSCGDYPPKFYSRQTGAFKFKLDSSS
eukprot:Ihof_evm1s127 gene=Ihof_evmTU1s127